MKMELLLKIVNVDCVLNKPLSLDVNKVCFVEKPISLIIMKTQQKTKALLNGTDVVECLCYHKIESLKYFELLGMRYGDTNAVTLRI